MRFMSFHSSIHIHFVWLYSHTDQCRWKITPVLYNSQARHANVHATAMPPHTWANTYLLLQTKSDFLWFVAHDISVVFHRKRRDQDAADLLRKPVKCVEMIPFCGKLCVYLNPQVIYSEAMIFFKFFYQSKWTFTTRSLLVSWEFKLDRTICWA